MRYTTVIDITECPPVYRNRHAREVYIHIALTAGYHDDDRDQVKISIRRLAAELGISVSACRHALGVLTKYKLVSRQRGRLFVRKWVSERAITPREQTKLTKKEQLQRRILEEQQLNLERMAEERQGAVSREEYLRMKKQKQNE